MKSRWFLSSFFLILFSQFLPFTTRAQQQPQEYLYEMGGSMGASWGYGDVNATAALYSPSLAFGLIARRNFNYRWSLAAELQADRLTGDTDDFSQTYRVTPYSFDRRLWMLSIRPEVHFWNYGFFHDYRGQKRYTPFLTLGLSAGVTTGDGESAFVFGIPMGAGFKFKITPRLNANITCLFTKTFSDKLDGLVDPTGISSNALIGNDWMAALYFSLTFEVKEKCVECHNQRHQNKVNHSKKR